MNLNSEKVRYLEIGGWAYNRYAEPRMTGDIDFFVATDLSNQQRLIEVLKKFGFSANLPPRGTPLFKKNMIMLGRPPHRIDLISEIDGVTFTEAWKASEKDKLDGLTVRFISAKMLIKNKRASGRAKDLSDIEMLRALYKSQARKSKSKIQRKPRQDNLGSC